MRKTGRPRALNLNPFAIEDKLRHKGMTKAALAAESGITPGQLGDALGSRRKGVSEATIRRLATVLECEPETIAPELTGCFVGVRPGDGA